nr:reverse transcriptase domain-containing protein [Tanacetum cinerariifolium]
MIRLTVFIPCAVFLKIHLIQEQGVLQPKSCLFKPNKTRPNFCINKLASSVRPDTRNYSEKLSAMANTTPIVTTVTKTATKEKTPNGAETTSRINILDFYEEHYEDILPVMDKIRRDKRREAIEGKVHSNDLATLTRQVRLRPGQTGNTLEMIPRVEVVLTNRTLLLAEIVLEAEAAPTTSKNRMVIPTLTKQGTNIGDPEDHVKFFQAAAQVERWAMPTWCHMFNSTLIGTARAWFDELPSKSIYGYTNLKAAFLAYFMQQKKYVKDPVEIHNIKQKDGETIEEFMKRFKIKTGHMKGAPECMRIFGFMHGVNNPELIKRLNEHVPKTLEDMMTATAAFIRGETAAASKKKVYTPWKSHDQSKRQNSERRSNFKSQSRDGWGSNKFTPLNRTPKEIFAAESGKFKPPPPMLKKQIEELVRAGKLSHFIKEIRRDRDQQKTGKKDAPVKDKAAAIYTIQPW